VKTARRLSEQEGGELEAFFWNSADLMVVLDAQLHMLRVNPAFSRQLGSQEGRSILEVCAPRDREKTKQTLLQCLQGGSREFSAAVVRPSQAMRACEWSVWLEPASTRLYVVMRDVTSRRRLERELTEAHKLEAVGQLASGIAHEINTPIQFIGDNLTFIGESMRDVIVLLRAVRAEGHAASVFEAHPDVDVDFLMKELPSAVDMACEGVQRVAELVRGMKEFAHQDHGEVTPTDLNSALSRTLTIARNEWKYVADIETDFGELPLVPCQASALRQVFLNLICNAAQTNGERNQETGRAKGLIRVATRFDGASVTVSISDTGNGIPDSAKARLFEPFFTTKPVGRGTGQGLAISRAIVCDKHHGRLEFETKVGVGTTFHVRLPIPTGPEETPLDS
jgi:PAS domain S-box-containing protein